MNTKLPDFGDDEERGYELVGDEDAVPTENSAPSDRPRRKKRRPRRSADIESEINENSGWWVQPLLLIAPGVIMCLFAAAKIAGVGQMAATIVAMCVYMIVVIPVLIVALMFIGSLLGIDYGEYKRAIANLTAIAFFNNGLMWMFAMGHIPLFLSFVVCGIVAFVLFMWLFELDYWETKITILALNIAEFGAQLLMMGLLN